MVKRRRLASGVSVVAAACSILSVVATAQERSDHVHQAFVFLPGPDGSPQRAHVIYPRRSDGASGPPDVRYPIVVALHGQGEAQKRPERAAIAWSVDYGLPAAFGALARRRLERVDLRTFIREDHLRLLNQELASQPFKGVMVVTPYVPDLIAERRSGRALARYGEWLSGPLLAAVRAQYPQAARSREATSIDGVSMGGWIALEVGFAHPESFGAVGGIQPAVTHRVKALAEAARHAGGVRGPQHIRLLSSDADPFLDATRGLSRALRQRRVPHTLAVVPGPHGIEFNRGPAVIELLRFADSTLLREPRPR